jgi:hypothetical protein
MCNLLIIEGRYILPVQLVVSVMGQQHLLEIVENLLLLFELCHFSTTFSVDGTYFV